MWEQTQEFLLRFANAGFVKLWLGGFLLGSLLELILTAEGNQPLRLKALNLMHAILYALIIFVGSPILGGVVNDLARSMGGARWHLPFFKVPDLWIQMLGTLCYFAAVDFFYYWWHRAQHVVPVLWDQHAVHHSETALNVTTAVRHHWSEFAFQLFVLTLPLLLLVDLTPSNQIVIATVFGLWQFFIHMNIRLHLGPFAWLLAGPQVHRIHHSIVAEHRDRNFAAYFPIWDVLFGTYWHPKPGEYPATGLANGERHGLFGLSFSPFVKWAKRLVPRRRKVQVGSRSKMS